MTSTVARYYIYVAVATVVVMKLGYIVTPFSDNAAAAAAAAPSGVRTTPLRGRNPHFSDDATIDTSRVL